MTGFKQIACKAIFLISFMVCFSTLLTAQEKTLDTVFSEVDAVISKYLHTEEGRVSALSAMLDSYAKQPQYSVIEMYVLKKARYYIIYSNYLYARDIAYAVVDHNLDNIDAAVLYDSANNAIARIEADSQNEEERRHQADLQKQIRTEQVKGRIREGQDYTVANTASGESVYFNRNVNMYYSPYIWKFSMRFMGLSLDLDSENVGIQYGAGAEGSFYYYGDSFGIGGEVLAEMALLSLAGDGGMTNTLKAIGCLGIPIKKSMLCARIGGFIHNTDMSSGADVFISPLVGIGWRDIHIGRSALLSCYFDYFPAHFMHDDLTFSGDTGLSLGFPLFSSDVVVMNFSVGFQDTIMIYDDGPKNTAEFVLALGVCNAE